MVYLVVGGVTLIGVMLVLRGRCFDPWTLAAMGVAVAGALWHLVGLTEMARVGVVLPWTDPMVTSVRWESTYRMESALQLVPGREAFLPGQLLLFVAYCLASVGCVVGMRRSTVGRDSFLGFVVAMQAGACAWLVQFVAFDQLPPPLPPELEWGDPEIPPPLEPYPPDAMLHVFQDGRIEHHGRLVRPAGSRKESELLATLRGIAARQPLAENASLGSHARSGTLRIRIDQAARFEEFVELSLHCARPDVGVYKLFLMTRAPNSLMLSKVSWYAPRPQLVVIHPAIAHARTLGVRRTSTGIRYDLLLPDGKAVLRGGSLQQLAESLGGWWDSSAYLIFDVDPEVLLFEAMPAVDTALELGFWGLVTASWNR